MVLETDGKAMTGPRSRTVQRHDRTVAGLRPGIRPRSARSRVTIPLKFRTVPGALPGAAAVAQAMAHRPAA